MAKISVKINGHLATFSSSPTLEIYEKEEDGVYRHKGVTEKSEEGQKQQCYESLMSYVRDELFEKNLISLITNHQESEGHPLGDFEQIKIEIIFPKGSERVYQQTIYNKK